MNKFLKGLLIAFVALGILSVLGIAFGGNDDSNDSVAKTETQHKKNKNVKDDKSEELTEENLELVDDNGNDIEENTEITESFRTEAYQYLTDLTTSYETIGGLADTEELSDMKEIVANGKSDFSIAEESFKNINPTNDKEQEIYTKLTRINGLSKSAIKKAETGLENEDVYTLESATNDIDESNSIMETLDNDFK